nr:unnamed protein product [Callosobruchus chinensis]
MADAEQFSSKGKRKRDPNTFDEKTKLISLIRKYYETVENKKTDAVSVLKKTEVWERIRTEFNALSSVPRTTDELKNIWENLKAETREKAAEERQSRMQTGGGPGQVTHIDPIFMEVLELIQYGAVGCLNPFDSDGVFDNEKDAPMNGDWSDYSSSKLRTPKVKILQELPHCSLEVDEDGHLRVTHGEGSSNANVRGSEKHEVQRCLQPLHITPTKSNVKRSQLTRKRLAPVVNQQLIEAKLQAICSAEAQATGEHEINMRMKNEQLKQEQLKTACLLLDYKVKKQQYLQKH